MLELLYILKYIKVQYNEFIIKDKARELILYSDNNTYQISQVISIIRLINHYLIKHNYKKGLLNVIADKFIELQESMIKDNELDINNRLLIYELFNRIYIYELNYSNIEYYDNMYQISEIVDKIFNKINSENYLTEIEIKKIIKKILKEK